MGIISFICPFFKRPRFIETIFKVIKIFLDKMKFDAKLFIYLSRRLGIILVNMIISFMRLDYILRGLTYFSRILFLYAFLAESLRARIHRQKRTECCSYN